MAISFFKAGCLVYIDYDGKDIGFTLRLGCERPNAGYEYSVERLSILWVSLGPFLQSHLFWQEEA